MPIMRTNQEQTGVGAGRVTSEEDDQDDDEKNDAADADVHAETPFACATLRPPHRFQ
jgi:hypothetical protein